MNLFLFPEAANTNNGYGFAVEKDFLKLHPSKSDLIVWYTILEKEDMGYLKSNDIIIKKNKTLSIKSIYNIFIGKDRTELLINELRFLKTQSFENIFCGDTIFYNAIRALFPNAYISVRFHNCFARIYDRKRLLRLTLDWKFSLKVINMYKLERQIFNDKKVNKIFISNEDRNYYTTMYGRKFDSEVWPIDVDINKIKKNRRPIKYSHSIVWFGGVESHKKASLVWFINEILPIIKDAIPDVEFHLWGRGTEKFNNHDQGVFAHGFFQGTGMPLKNAIYINPDLIGGGVKIKIQTYLENGIPFVSSPFGYEGYSMDLIDNKYCFVEENDNWADRIIKIFKS